MRAIARPTCHTTLGILASLALCGLAHAECVEPGGLRLSEVFYDVAGGPDDGFEWVELFNSGSTTVVLDGNYSLGWGGSTYGFGTIDLQGSIAPGETFVVGGPSSTAANFSPLFQQIASPALTLQNGGTTADGVALFAGTATSIGPASIPLDAVIYGVSNDSLLLDESGNPGAVDVGNAPSGQSLERTPGGWQIQPAPTPNVTALARAPSPVVLSEVFYDVAGGPDAGFEWIELFNRGSAPVQLTGRYSIGAGGSDYTFDQHDLQGTLDPGETFLIGGPGSNAGNANPDYDQVQILDLQNSGAIADGVALFDRAAVEVDAATVPVDSLIYGGSNDNGLLDENGNAGAPDAPAVAGGESLERDGAGWSAQAAPSPGTSPLAVGACPVFGDGFETQ